MFSKFKTVSCLILISIVLLTKFSTVTYSAFQLLSKILLRGSFVNIFSGLVSRNEWKFYPHRSRRQRDNTVHCTKAASTSQKILINVSYYLQTVFSMFLNSHLRTWRLLPAILQNLAILFYLQTYNFIMSEVKLHSTNISSSRQWLFWVTWPYIKCVRS